jgi:hypothetical protein
MRRFRLFTKMGDGSDGVVDGKQKSAETELGKCDLEERFIDCSRCEDGDDLFRGNFTGWAWKGEVVGGVVNRKSID